MRGIITKIDKRTSTKTNQMVYMVCFKCDDGKSRISWIDSGYRNFKNWEKLLVVDNELDNLIVAKKPDLIDADSKPTLVE